MEVAIGLGGGLLLILAFVGGYVTGRAERQEVVRPVAPPSAPTYVPLPFPVASEPGRAQFTVQLRDDDGNLSTVSVPRRTLRIYAQGRTWDHAGTASSGLWEYRPTDVDTPRQVQQKAMARES